MSASAGDVVRTALRGIGQTLMTVGVVLLLFCVYELKITSLVTEREQERLGVDLRQEWARTAADPPSDGLAPGGIRPVAVELGTGFAVLRIPALGSDYAKVLVEGTGVEALKKGPGRIAGTADPGQLGNTVLSGHRTTYGAPFERLDELRPGDAVVLETAATWFTYRVTETRIVAPTAVEVTYPVPGQRDAQPTQSLLTLTTCHPKYSARQRMIVFGVLDETLQKADGDPSALTGA